jgi:phage terminase large subunit-like protein
MLRKHAPSSAFFRLIDYKPYPYQQAVHDSWAQYRVVVVGRQSGKSQIAAVEAAYEILFSHGSRGWVVAPTYEQATFVFERVAEMVKKAHERLPGKREISLSRRMMRLDVHHYDSKGRFVATSRFQGKTSDNPDNLRGATLDYLIMDEAAMTDQQVFFESLLPTLTTTQGWVLLITTPKGYDWVYELFRTALEYKDKPGWPNHTQYACWQLPTWEANPNVSAEFFEQQKRIQPERAFRQEYGAEFIPDSGSVFQRLWECPKQKVWHKTENELFVTPINTQSKFHRYVIGADFARLDDFSVFTVLNLDTRTVVRVQRLNTVSWERQLNQLAALQREYPNSFVVVDSRGIGDPLTEQLANMGVPLSTANFGTTVEKEKYINKLALLIENQRIVLPDDKEYIQEFADFVYERTPSGALKMHAAGRGKDDRVVSLAMAAWYLPEENPALPHAVEPNFTVDIEDAFEELDDLSNIPL